jgi:hypothetical protein
VTFCWHSFDDQLVIEIEAGALELETEETITPEDLEHRDPECVTGRSKSP